MPGYARRQPIDSNGSLPCATKLDRRAAKVWSAAVYSMLGVTYVSSERDEGVAEEWSRTIGRYINSFAYVELLVYELLEMLPRDPVSESHTKLRDFSERARLLQALIRSSKWADKDGIEATIEKLLPLATLRNQLAHNPLYIDLYTDGGVLVEVPRIIEAKKRKPMDHIDLRQLHLKSEMLSNLAAELAFQIGFLRVEKK